MFRFLPEQASDFAYKVDWLNNWITDLSVFFTVLIFGAAILFAIIYRRKDGKDHETPQIEGDHRLEILWTVIPTIIVIFIGYYGYAIHREMRIPPSDTLDIHVSARKWTWDFEYANGKKTNSEFTVPVNKPIKMIMRSSDVLHSFFIPSMRVKNDVLPNRYTYVWFRPIKTGTYQTFCTEYCGLNHSAMLAKLHVVSESEYERWLNDNSEEIRRNSMTPAERGQKLYSEKGCNACHSINGTPIVGPTFKGLWNKKEELVDGSSLTVDENYLEESILNPNAKIVQGFAPNLMPAFEGQLSSEEVTSLIAFIKEVDSFAQEASSTSDSTDSGSAASDTSVSAEDLAAMTPEQRGKHIYETNLCMTCHSIDGSRLVGPSFKGIVGRSGKLADGSSYVADEAYIKHSVLKPNDQVVEGYVPAMPSFEGKLSDDQLNDVIAFMKSLN
ncbi:MAG: cytochrome c oxidase subunit II [Bdellovibrionales bacterium]|nr:cytochrome c oxidase subunit II [Bdellovibrionales bacterium]